MVQPIATTTHFSGLTGAAYPATVIGNPILHTVTAALQSTVTAIQAPVPVQTASGEICNPVQPGLALPASQCNIFNEHKHRHHYLKASIRHGNPALDGVFVAAPTVLGHEVARVTRDQGKAAHAVYDHLTRSYFLHDALEEAELCEYHGLALITHGATELGPVGLILGAATGGAELYDGVFGFLDLIGSQAPFSFGSWYVCEDDMTLKYLRKGWQRGTVQNVDFGKCAAVVLHRYV